MKFRDLLFLSTLVGAASGATGCELLTGPTTSSFDQEKRLPSSVDGYEKVFNLPEEFIELSNSVRSQISSYLNCPSDSNFFYVFDGLYRETDISNTNNVALLSDITSCNEVACTVNVLQYLDGKMTNGFSVSGICGNTEEDIKNLNDSGLKPDLDLTGVVNKKIVLEHFE